MAKAKKTVVNLELEHAHELGEVQVRAHIVSLLKNNPVTHDGAEHQITVKQSTYMVIQEAE